MVVIPEAHINRADVGPVDMADVGDQTQLAAIAS